MSSNDTHGGMQHMMDKAQDTLGGMAGRMAAKTAGSHSASQFIENAAIGDLYEITASRIALRRAKSAEVKAVAAKMIHDHTTSTHQLRSALRTNEAKGLPAPPTALDERRKTMIEHLEKAPDDKFDATYLDQQVLAHQENHDLMSGFMTDGDNPQLRSFAHGTEPVVKRHLNHMKMLKGAS